MSGTERRQQCLNLPKIDAALIVLILKESMNLDVGSEADIAIYLVGTTENEPLSFQRT